MEIQDGRSPPPCGYPDGGAAPLFGHLPPPPSSRLEVSFTESEPRPSRRSQPLSGILRSGPEALRGRSIRSWRARRTSWKQRPSTSPGNPNMGSEGQPPTCTRGGRVPATSLPLGAPARRGSPGRVDRREGFDGGRHPHPGQYCELACQRRTPVGQSFAAFTATSSGITDAKGEILIAKAPERAPGVAGS